MKRRKKGVESLKARYGTLFVTPWMFGLVVFFIYPLLQSVRYTFSDIRLAAGGLDIDFIGLENFRYILYEDAEYLNNLAEGFSTFFYTFPLILVVSIVMGVILASKFKGRIIFRCINFISVIIASGVLLKIMFDFSGSNGISSENVDAAIMENMIDFESIVEVLGLPSKIAIYFQNIMNRLMLIIWSSGVQTLLIIAGLQSIPDSMYEASKIEGATAWEEFWFITMPMLSRIIMLVAAFTAVEIFTSVNDVVVSQSYTYMSSQRYGLASAMLWLYFIIIGVLVGTIFFLYNRFCQRRWE